MAGLYLLDTNIVSHLVRQPQGPVAEHIADVGEANVLTSVIVACELRYGAAKRGSRRLTRRVDAVLTAMTIRPLESDIERVYASIRVALERKGTPIGAHDLLIAAHARALDAVCVTDNVAEFKRVPALEGSELAEVTAHPSLGTRSAEHSHPVSRAQPPGRPRHSPSRARVGGPAAAPPGRRRRHRQDAERLETGRTNVHRARRHR